MGHSYEDSKKTATKIITILAIVTIVEVLIALLGKGYIISGFHMPHWLISAAMLIGSVYKAYLIIYEFMHMKYEVPALVKTVLFPTLLLVWAIISFTMEGNYWLTNRSKFNNQINDKQMQTGTQKAPALDHK